MRIYHKKERFCAVLDLFNVRKTAYLISNFENGDTGKAECWHSGASVGVKLMPSKGGRKAVKQGKSLTLMDFGHSKSADQFVLRLVSAPFSTGHTFRQLLTCIHTPFSTICDAERRYFLALSKFRRNPYPSLSPKLSIDKTGALVSFGKPGFGSRKDDANIEKRTESRVEADGLEILTFWAGPIPALHRCAPGQFRVRLKITGIPRSP